jgi:hypothetical protein
VQIAPETCRVNDERNKEYVYIWLDLNKTYVVKVMFLYGIVP